MRTALESPTPSTPGLFQVENRRIGVGSGCFDADYARFEVVFSSLSRRVVSTTNGLLLKNKCRNTSRMSLDADGINMLFIKSRTLAEASHLVKVGTRKIL